MNLYIYNNLPENPVVASLLKWRESGDTSLYYNACAGLLQARMGLREYAAAVLMDDVPPIDRPESMAYFHHDIDEIYENILSFDWNGLCKKSGVLPLPDFSHDSSPNASDYDKTAAKLKTAESAAEFGGVMIDFFSNYSCADEAKYDAFMWENGSLRGVAETDAISFGDMAALGSKKDALIENTAAFVSGRPAQDTLLAGASGTGKSSCVKAVFNMYRPAGLKLAELLKEDISALPKLMEEIGKRKRQYIIFIDDLSFDGSDANYKALKVALDGRIGRRPANTLLYATSNRVHLVRETWKDREESEDIHENETMHEKMSLSERFGLRLYFQALTQPEYFEIVALLLAKQGVEFDEETGKKAAAWEMRGNGRSGRTAKQFVDWNLGAGTWSLDKSRT